MKDELTGRSEEVEEDDDEEEEEEETASSRKRCMTPRVSSILGFPEEKGKACVRDESEDVMEVEVEVESPEIIAGGGRDTSSFDGPAISVTVVEVVGIAGCNKRPEFSNL